MMGYYKKPEETAAVLKGDYMYTGDLGFVDGEGYLSVVDRKKDLVISSGFNVYPVEVDNVLFDHPAVLVGKDNGPTPVEMLMIALAGCIMSGIGNIAAARKVKLDEVTATVEGEIDLQGILGLSKDVRNGYQKMRLSFDIKGDAPAEKLRQIVEQSRARSAVYDVVTNGVPVEIAVKA